MEDKFAKRTACEYCGGKMDAKYRNKRFCSDKCRTYFNREHPKVKIQDLSGNTHKVQNLTQQQPKTNFSINTIKTGDGAKNGDSGLSPWQLEQRKKKLGF